MQTIRAAAVAAAAAIAAAGCYFGDDDSGGGGDGGPADGADPDAAPPPERRSVNFVLAESGASSVTSNAEFNREGEPSGTCLVEHIGPCVVEDACMPEAGALPQAGTITITGDITSIVMTPSGEGRYPMGSAGGPMWSAGAAVRFQASGGDVPAFDETVTGAGTITLTEPAIAGSLVIARDQPLHVAWTGGDESSVLIAFVYMDAGGQGTMRCTYDGVDGQADIPVEALEQLPAGGSGSFVATGENRRTVRIGDAFDTRLIARAAFQRFTAMFL